MFFITAGLTIRELLLGWAAWIGNSIIFYSLGLNWIVFSEG
jgi:hypothetical protein